MQEVHDFMKKAGTYYLATIDGDLPRVRPFGTFHLFEDKYYILTGKKKDLVQQINANPQVELSVADGDDWIRIAATLIEDDRAAAQESMLEAYPQLQGMYAVNDGNMVVYYLQNATATFYSFGGEPRIVQF